MRPKLLHHNKFKFILIILLIFFAHASYAGAPEIISVNMAPANPGYGDLVNIYVQACVNKYTSAYTAIAFSSSSSRIAVGSAGQVFVVSIDGVDQHQVQPNVGNSEFGYPDLDLAADNSATNDCADCGGDVNSRVINLVYQVHVPDSSYFGSCGETGNLYLHVGMKDSYLGKSDWTTQLAACNSYSSAAWPQPVPDPNFNIAKSVEGTLQTAGDKLLYKIDYNYQNGSNFQIVENIPAGFAIEAYEPTNIPGGNVTQSGSQITWLFPSMSGQAGQKSGTVWVLLEWDGSGGPSFTNTATGSMDGLSTQTSSVTIEEGEAAIQIEKSQSVDELMLGETITYYLSYEINGYELRDFESFEDAVGVYSGGSAPPGWKTNPTSGGLHGTWTVEDPCNTGEQYITGESTDYPGLLLDDGDAANDSDQFCEGMIVSDVMIGASTSFPGADAQIVIRNNGMPSGNGIGIVVSIDNAPSPGYFMYQRCSGASCSYQGGMPSIGAPIAGKWYRVRILVEGNRIRSKIWERGEAEPAGWDIDYTDATLSTADWACDGTGTYDDWRPGVNEQSGDYDDVLDSYDNFTSYAPRTFESAPYVRDDVPPGTIYRGCIGCSGNPPQWTLPNTSFQAGSLTWWAEVTQCGPISNRAIINGGTDIYSNWVNAEVLCWTPTFTVTNTPNPETPTFTATRTVTRTNTPTPTFTRTNTPTPTYTYTLTRTPTPTFTRTPTPTPTFTYTLTRTPTPTFTNTTSPTPTYTYTLTNTPTPTFTNTTSPTPTFTFTLTNTPTPTFTDTMSPTPTFTFTMTDTPTPTYTMTATYTYTATATDTIPDPPTNTTTPTFTPTATFTLTNTPTPTFTDTMSPTPTFTATMTDTPSPTYTVTVTFTYTATATDTIPDPPTRTATPTFTLTATNTLTSTPTPTYTVTSTFTYTATATDTVPDPPTSTSTSTHTMTSTATLTFTPTPTYTATRTYTPSMTFTPTMTVTPTFTPTFLDTYTYTPTHTPTATNTPTFTVTNTYTLTFTLTYTTSPTYTFTITETVTPTFTPTYSTSPTFTMTNTPTFTVTETYTPTFTATFSASPTGTPTDSPTFTPTFTYTETPTITLTSTPTPTFTPTSTATYTLTVTPTMAAYPYVLEIGIYNEAGELVRTVIKENAGAPMSAVEISVDGDTETSVVSSGSELSIYLPGVETPATQGKGGSEFFWDLSNDQGQGVSGGKYYIKLEQVDKYGRVETYVDDITVINSEEYVELRVFNASGELVRTIRDYSKSLESAMKLDLKNIMVIEDGVVSNFTVSYGTSLGEIMYWDGMNENGISVTNGTYEIQVVANVNGDVYEASKTVVVINEGSSFLEDVRVYPSPFRGEAAEITFAWTTGGETGKNVVRIYNMAGELVAVVKGKIEDGLAAWDLRNTSGNYVSNGYYIAVFEAVNSGGHVNREKAKFAIISNYE